MSSAISAGEAATATVATATPELGFDPDALRAKYRQERDTRQRPDGINQFVEVAGDYVIMLTTPMSSLVSPVRRCRTTSMC
jgi:hypothetical protein